jgi:hypothetical protein
MRDVASRPCRRCGEFTTTSRSSTWSTTGSSRSGGSRWAISPRSATTRTR